MSRRLHGGALKAAKAARDLIAQLGIRDPAEIDVARIAAYHDAHVVFDDLASEQGYLLRNARCGIITLDRRTRRSNQWRFALAHELGHYLRHAGRDQFAVCDDLRLHRWYRGSNEEIEANAFAAELLMPSAMFGPACEVDRPSLHVVRELADEFSTSLMAAALRFVAFAPVRSAVVYARNGRIAWWDAARDFPFTFERGFSVRGTYADDALAGRELPDGPEEIDPELWSTDTRAEHEPALFEHATRLGEDGALSLLWVPDALDDPDREIDDDEASVEDGVWSFHGLRFHR